MYADVEFFEAVLGISVASRDVDFGLQVLQDSLQLTYFPCSVHFISLFHLALHAHLERGLEFAKIMQKRMITCDGSISCLIDSRLANELERICRDVGDKELQDWFCQYMKTCGIFIESSV